MYSRFFIRKLSTMNRNVLFPLLLTGSAVLLSGCHSSSDKDVTASNKTNIIVMVTDGASDGAWDIASFWQNGEQLLNDTYPFNALDTRYAMATYALNGQSSPDDSEECDSTTYADGFSYEPSKAISEALTEAQSIGSIIDFIGMGDLTNDIKCDVLNEGLECTLVAYGEESITVIAEMRDLVFDGYDYLNSHYTDSAASGTAMATGQSTYNGAISIDNCGAELPIITEYAKAAGLATGIVSTVPFSHATPAVFGARNHSRSSTPEIGADMLKNGYADLIMGAGHPKYDANSQAQDAEYTYLKQGSWKELEQGSLIADGFDKPWHFFDSVTDFEALANGSATNELLSHPIIGLVKNIETLQQARSACEGEVDAFECEFNTDVPDLPTMSVGALNYLNQSENGFFVMIEGGAVDWAAHANDTARLIEEQVDFNNAVKSVYEWVEQNSSWDETLLIVTTDHGNSFVLGESSDLSIYHAVEPVAKHIMPEVRYYSGNHTNELVRLYAKGNGEGLFEQHVIGKDDNFPIRYRHTGTDGSYVQNIHIFDVVKKVIEK